MAKSDTLVLGIISLVFGIIALVWWNPLCIAAVVAIILGSIAMKGRSTGRVLGIVGLVLGIIAAILWTLSFFNIWHIF